MLIARINNKKHIGLIVVSLSIGALGMSIPGCPGQQVQEQVKTLQTLQSDLTKKIQDLNNQITALNNEMRQVKQLLPQMTNVMQVQKTTLDQLESTVKELKEKHGKHKKRH